MRRLVLDTPGLQLSKRGERLVVHQDGVAVRSIPVSLLEQVLIVGKSVGTSTPVLHELVRRGVDVVFQDRSGRLVFRLEGPRSLHAGLRLAQALVASDKVRSLELARGMVEGKLANQAAVLRRFADKFAEGRSAADLIDRERARAGEAADVAALRGHEGRGAALYFGAWPELVRPWGFKGRAYHPPPDPLNALLSLGYTLLLNDALGAAHRVGLDPAIGFFHAPDYGRPSLALDMEEEFRAPVVDALVLELVAQEAVTPADFVREPGQRLMMEAQSRRLFFACYQEQMETRVKHGRRGHRLTYRQCLAKQAEQLARCILEGEQYRPFVLGGAPTEECDERLRAVGAPGE